MGRARRGGKKERRKGRPNGEGEIAFSHTVFDPNGNFHPAKRINKKKKRREKVRLC